MSFDLYNKTLIVLILVLFIGTSIIPSISGDYNNNQDTIPFTFYTFDKTGTKECKVEISTDSANIISDTFEELKQKITNYPMSSETKTLKNNFVDLLDSYDLIPQGVSKDYIVSLLNPRGKKQTENNIPILRNPIILNNIIPKQLSNTGYAVFCSLAGTGRGLIFTPIIFPRPRLLTVWSAYSSAFSTAANLYTGHGFVASGGQTGVALGFWGIGLSFAFPGEPANFGFGGYALLAMVRADEIETYPLNQKPIISEEHPSEGSVNVPVDLSELSFKIEDGDGDRMSYMVATVPDVGGGEGNGFDGVYSVPISGLNSNTEYSWSVFVSDGEDTSEKKFSFHTEIEPPFISDTIPVDGDSWVSVDLSELSFSLEDLQGDSMNYTVETVPDIGNSSSSGVGNGVYSVDINGLNYTTEYSWFVNVTDGKYWTRRIFSFKTQPILVFDPYDEGWQYRKKITINHSQVAGDLMDFPVLISVVDSNLRDKVQIDGDDVLFMDGSGVASRLFHEIEFFDGSSGEIVAWVNVSNLSSSVDTVLYLYYGNSDCSSQEYPFMVWKSDYIAVYHMDGSKYTDIDDSTFNNLDVIEQQGNPVFQQSGKIGYCVDFDEASLNVDDNDLLSFTFGSNQDKPFTIEVWVKHDSAGGDDNVIISKYANMKREWTLRKYKDDKCELRLVDDSTEASIWRKTSLNINVNNMGWNYISATYSGDKSGYDIGMILDGSINNGETWTGSNYKGIENLDEKMRIGAFHSHQYGWHYWQGLIDEVRISNNVRSSEWLTASYNTMNDPSSFSSIGPEESIP